MRNLNLSLQAGNFATVTVVGKGNAVMVRVDPELQWDREGLKELSAALAGVAEILTEP